LSRRGIEQRGFREDAVALEEREVAHLGGQALLMAA
jgi:hypothetical protein